MDFPIIIAATLPALARVRLLQQLSYKLMVVKNAASRVSSYRSYCDYREILILPFVKLFAKPIAKPQVRSPNSEAMAKLAVLAFALCIFVHMGAAQVEDPDRNPHADLFAGTTASTPTSTVATTASTTGKEEKSLVTYVSEIAQIAGTVVGLIFLASAMVTFLVKVCKGEVQGDAEVVRAAVRDMFAILFALLRSLRQRG